MSDVHDLEQDFKELLVTKRRAPAAKGRNPPCDSHAHHQASRNRTKLKTYRALRCLTIEIPSSPIESKGRKRLADVVGMKGSWPMCEEILCEKVFNDFAYRKIWSCARLFSHRNASAKLDFPPHPEQNGMFVVRVDLPIVSSCLPLSPRRVNESSLPDILETEEMLQPSARIDEMDDTPVRHMPWFSAATDSRFLEQAQDLATESCEADVDAMPKRTNGARRSLWLRFLTSSL
jgi:hypothetical protein